MLLYTGSCGDLECLDGNDETSSTEYQSAIDFDSVEGETYYALVHGYFSSTGPFEIELIQLTPLVIAENDECANATSLEIDGPAVEGDTSQSTPEIGLATCGMGNTLGSTGLWYALVGNGERLIVGVRALNFTYDPQLIIFFGDSCDTLVCLDSNDNTFAGGYDSAVPFESVEGENYCK